METIIYGVLKEEKVRNIEMQETYKKELETLKKGRIRQRNRAGKTYYYLQYRNGTKIHDEYIGTNYDDVKKIQSELNRRKRLKDVMKRLKHEYKQICKIVKE